MDKTKKIILISVISVVVIILIAVGIWLVVRGNNENNGENQISKIQELYNTLSEKDTYSFKTTVDDNNSSYFAKQGDKSYMEVKIDGETSKYLMMDGNMYYIKLSIYSSFWQVLYRLHCGVKLSATLSLPVFTLCCSQ